MLKHHDCLCSCCKDVNCSISVFDNRYKYLTDKRSLHSRFTFSSTSKALKKDHVNSSGVVCRVCLG